MKQPLVTVITATDNIIKNDRKASFLQAVKSVKKQKYPNVEHLIIDNASKDGSIKLFEKCNLKYISEPDKGIFEAFNKGVKLAKGKYIIFLNSDDFYHNMYGLANCVETLENSKADFCFSECNIMIDSGYKGPWIPEIYKTFRQMPVCHQTVMCKKSLLEKFPFDESYKIIADYKWFMTLILNKIPYAQVNCNFVNYRLFGKSTLEFETCIKESKRAYKELFEHLYKLSDEELDKAIKTTMFPQPLEEKLMELFEDKELYKEESYEAMTSRMNILPENPLTKMIQDCRTEQNSKDIDALLEKYKPLFSEINKYLFKKLIDIDRTTFVNFLFKRFGNLNSCSAEEKYILDEIFEKTYHLYQSRASIDTPLPVVIFDKQANMLSPTPIYTERPTDDKILLGCYEYAHTFALNEYFLKDFEPENSQSILDCGASIGDATIFFKTKYPASKVYSIEYDDKNYEYLQKNIELNNYNDVVPIKTFVTNQNAENMSTIDEIVKKYKINNLGLIKLDIEGAERFALYGAKETIIKQKPKLIIPIYHIEDDCLQIPKFLNSLNLPMTFRLKWLERRIWGMDCTLFVKFI